jgi:hypothetical protein
MSLIQLSAVAPHLLTLDNEALATGFADCPGCAGSRGHVGRTREIYRGWAPTIEVRPSYTRAPTLKGVARLIPMFGRLTQRLCRKPLRLALLRAIEEGVNLRRLLWPRRVHASRSCLFSIGNFRLSGLYLTGSDDQEDIGPTSVNLSREVHSVARARHLNVGKKQPHVVAGFERFQRGVGVRGFDDLKPVLLEQASRVHAQTRVVFDHEYYGLGLAN